MKLVLSGSWFQLRQCQHIKSHHFATDSLMGMSRMLSTTASAGFRSGVTFEDRLASDVTAALRNAGYPEFQTLDVGVDGHDISLRGRVPNFFLRQKAEYVVLGIPGVATLQSAIEVAK